MTPSRRREMASKKTSVTRRSTRCRRDHRPRDLACWPTEMHSGFEPDDTALMTPCHPLPPRGRNPHNGYQLTGDNHYANHAGASAINDHSGSTRPNLRLRTAVLPRRPCAPRSGDATACAAILPRHSSPRTSPARRSVIWRQSEKPLCFPPASLKSAASLLSRNRRFATACDSLPYPTSSLGHRGCGREIEAHLVQFLRRKALTMRCPLLVWAQFDANHSLLN